MTIKFDSGWQVVGVGRCYVRRSRVVLFELLTPPEEIQAFIDAYNVEAAKHPYGQVDKLYLLQDGTGLTVKGVQECDSGD
jgi:hypothetical protein